MRPVACTLAFLILARHAVATLTARELIRPAGEKKPPRRNVACVLNQADDIDSQRHTFSKPQPCVGLRCAWRTLATLLIALNTATATSIENSAAPNHIGFRSELPKDFLCSGYSHKDKRGSEVFSFGNYNRYYTGSAEFRSRRTDERLDAVKQWFQQLHLRGGGADVPKHCAAQLFNRFIILDIGCNDGQVTAEIAKAAEPDGKVLGIDCDTSLIDTAREQWCQNQAIGCNSRGGSHEDPASQSNLFFESVNMMDVTNSLHPDVSKGARIFADFVRKAPTPQTNIAHANGLNRADSPAGRFNIIFAFSVTKWIHFHYGDTGLKEFFECIYHLLSDSDVQGQSVNYLVLEPQPWKSYHNEKALRNKKPWLKLRPKSFQAWLEGEIDDVSFNSNILAGRKFAANGGFKLVHSIKAGDMEGFHRDLFIYKKRARNSDSEKL